MLRRIILFFTGILLLASSIMFIFVNICGSGDGSVVNSLYLSQADTSDIPSAGRDVTRWTFYTLCGVTDNKNSECSSSAPAYPYSPEDNFYTSDNIPQTFLSRRALYYYGSRSGYAFLLVGLIFNAFTCVSVFITCCISGYGLGIWNSILGIFAFCCNVGAASLLTALHVEGVTAFKNSGHDAKLGTRVFALMWVAVAFQFISCILLLCTTCFARNSNDVNHPQRSSYEQHSYDESYPSVKNFPIATGYPPEKQYPPEKTGNYA